MHPSNNLILPILRKHGDRLLKAQTEAMVKELSGEEQKQFLQRHVVALLNEVRERLAKSYPGHRFLSDWDRDTLRGSAKAWIFILSGEQNFFIGIPDFTLILSEFELGKPANFLALKPQTNEHIYSLRNESLVINGYKVLPSSVPHALPRLSNNEIEDAIMYRRNLIANAGETNNPLLKLLIDTLIKKVPTKK